jgi:hypothetical protein
MSFAQRLRLDEGRKRHGAQVMDRFECRALGYA